MPILTPEETRFAWRVGEIAYRLRNLQKLIRQQWLKASDKWLKFYVECTRRAGKSSFGLNWLAEDAIKNPGSVSAFFAPVKEGLRDYIVPIIAKTLEDCPEDLRPTLDSSLTLTFPNGSRIVFRGSNNQQHRIRRGNAFRRVFIDEARDVDDLDNLLESVVMPSLFSTNGRVMISSTPADTEDHPLYPIKQQAEKEGWYFKATILDAGSYDPADFTPERIAQWKRETTDEVAWKREYMAEWVKDPTKIIIPEWQDSYVQAVPHDEYFQHYHKYVAMDLGVKDKTAAIFGYYDFKAAKLVIEAEFALKDSDVLTDKIARKVKSMEVSLGYQLSHDRQNDEYKSLLPHQKTFRRVADNNNLLLLNDLNALYHLDFFPTRKDELPAMINLVREWVKDGRVIVNPSCVEMLGCLRNAVWDKNKKELARSKVYGHFDALMALVYMVRNVDTHTNPIPKHFNKSWETHAIGREEVTPQTGAYQLARAFKVTTEAEKARHDFVRGNV